MLAKTRTPFQLRESILPIASSEAMSPVTHGAVSEDRVGPSILLLEDEPMLRHLMTRVLTESGFSVLEGEDGRQGVQLARAHRGRFLIAVTDIDMPVMDGCAFARAFRLLFPDVPILFTSGHPDRYQDGMLPNCDLLEKPFEPDGFLATVHRLLAKVRNERRVSGQ
jgi:DNA-binding response OmpR family regulator